MARQYEGKVQLVGVAGRDSVAAMKGFVERHGLDFVPHAADTSGDLWADLGVRHQPTWIFVNGTDGRATTDSASWRATSSGPASRPCWPAETPVARRA